MKNNIENSEAAEPSPAVKEALALSQQAARNWAIALGEALKLVLASEGVGMNDPSERFSQVIGISRHAYYQLTRGVPFGSFTKTLFYSQLLLGTMNPNDFVTLSVAHSPKLDPETLEFEGGISDADAVKALKNPINENK